MAHKGLKEYKGLRAQMVKTVPKAHKVFRELRALTVRMGPLGCRAPKAPQEMMVKTGLPARKGLKD
jgi:hypothetical protein